MNTFGKFLYTLRKEKGMTQAALAERLGVTNKAVSKWETGEAMPETSFLLPIADIFGVTVDELLKGRRAESGGSERSFYDDLQGRRAESGGTERSFYDDLRGRREESGGNERSFYDDLRGRREESDDGHWESRDDIEEQIKEHMFTRGKEEPKTKLDIISKPVCSVVVLLGIAAYLLLGGLTNHWHPYWVIVPVCALFSGIVGIIFSLCDKEKCAFKLENGKSPYTDGICGIIMLSCVITYLFIGAFASMWYPYWLLILCGAIVDGIVGAIGNYYVAKKKEK